MKSIPFYPNHPDNMHCTQAVFRSLFEYFFDNKVDWNEIDRITKTIPGKGSWTMAAHIELAHRGVEIINVEPFDYKAYYDHGLDYLKGTFENDTVNYYIEKSNLLAVRDDIPLFLQSVHHESRKATITDIDHLLDKGYLVGAEINSRVLNMKSGFSLHYVLIHNGDNDVYLVNDPGGGSSPPLENRVVANDELILALGNEGSNGEISGFRLRKTSSVKMTL